MFFLVMSPSNPTKSTPLRSTYRSERFFYANHKTKLLHPSLVWTQACHGYGCYHSYVLLPNIEDLRYVSVRQLIDETFSSGSTIVLILGGKVDGQVIHQLKKLGFQVEVLPLRLGDGPFSSHRQHRVACAALRSKCREVCVKTQWDHWRFSVFKATVQWYIAREKDRAMEGDGCVYWLGPRWWFQLFSIFTPKFGEDEPILTSIACRWGWFNHQSALRRLRMKAIHAQTLKVWSFLPTFGWFITHEYSWWFINPWAKLLVIHLPK